MENFESKVCTACHPDAPKATDQEINQFLSSYNDWELTKPDNVSQLRRIYKFSDYEKAVDFTNKIAELSEKEGHHPSILLEWGKVTVNWWTHKILGLHENDFIMSAKTEKIYLK